MPNREFLEIISLTLFLPPSVNHCLLQLLFFNHLPFFREINACLFSKIIVFGGKQRQIENYSPTPLFPREGATKKLTLFISCVGRKSNQFSFWLFQFAPETRPLISRRKKRPPLFALFMISYFFFLRMWEMEGSMQCDYTHARSLSSPFSADK